MIRLLFLLIPLVTTRVNALDCVQCDRSGFDWQTEDESLKHAENCQFGLIKASPCRNSSHTHCIVSWFRSGMSQTRTVTERKCGTIDDAKGCTLYNAQIQRKVRHLINRDTSPKRSEQQSLFVEVCSEACPGGECVSSSTKFSTILAILLSLFFSFRCKLM